VTQEAATEDVWAVGDAAVAELGRALYAAGVILPSIGLDLASTVGGTPLINLGRINLATAEVLTKALNRATVGSKRRRP
jgi:hypothetical protein